MRAAAGQLVVGVASGSSERTFCVQPVFHFIDNINKLQGIDHPNSALINIIVSADEKNSAFQRSPGEAAQQGKPSLQQEALSNYRRVPLLSGGCEHQPHRMRFRVAARAGTDPVEAEFKTGGTAASKRPVQNQIALV